LTEEQFISTPHVVHRERMRVASQAIEQALAARHRQLNAQFHVQNALTLCNAVANSDLIGTLPERFAHALALKFPLQVLPIPLAVANVRQAMYWHERTHKHPGHQWFRELVTELAKSL
jgi:DNA-binding transcriptional LysR family regulator